MGSFFEDNRRGWDERAPAHAASPGYYVDRFAEDPSFVSHVVTFDRPRLGDVSGLRGVHLQCHIGTDTVSLASLAQARVVAQKAGVDVDFVEAEVSPNTTACRGRHFRVRYRARQESGGSRTLPSGWRPATPCRPVSPDSPRAARSIRVPPPQPLPPCVCGRRPKEASMRATQEQEKVDSC